MKLLLIRGKHDYYTYKAFDAAELVKTHAIAKNWNVIDKAGKDANKKDVLAAFDGTVDFVIHYSHGGKAELFGQKKNGNKKEKIIDDKNVKVLKEVNTSTVSCWSAKDLGEAAINDAGTNAYLGYEVPIAFPYSTIYLNQFVEAYNTPNMKLLEGLNFQKAHDAGRSIFMQKYNYMGQDPPSEDRFFAQAAMLWAYNGLKLCGNGNAKAT